MSVAVTEPKRRPSRADARRDHHGRAAELLSDAAGRVVQLLLLLGDGAGVGLCLLHRGRGGRRRQLARQQEVAGVPVGYHLDLAGARDVLDVV